jgi:DNA-binding response OmpR family regulator
VNIALLEDDPDQAVIIAEWLVLGGHHCDCFESGTQFTQSVKHNTYDVLLLDWLIPDMNGIDVLLWVREHMEWHIPVLFVTKMDREEDIVHALNQGADDYMTKPIRQMEMLARVEALRRRTTLDSGHQKMLALDPYCIDLNQRKILKHGEHITMTHIEFDLAVFMFRNSGRVLSRSYILEHVWGKNTKYNTRTIDTHMSRIRKKLAICSENGWNLVPIYQHGYRLEKLTTK